MTDMSEFLLKNPLKVMQVSVPPSAIFQVFEFLLSRKFFGHASRHSANGRMSATSFSDNR